MTIHDLREAIAIVENQIEVDSKRITTNVGIELYDLIKKIRQFLDELEEGITDEETRGS